MAEGIKNIMSYAALIYDKASTFRYPPIKAFIPNPNENEYKKGFINRYFVQKMNDINSPIIEVHESNFSDLKESGFYICIEIRWKLTGMDEEIKTANKKSINTVFGDMPKLGIYLPNLLQFREKKDLELL